MLHSRVLQIALALLQRDLRLDDVGMRHFTALFLLLRDVEELLGLAQADLRVYELPLRRENRVIILHDGRVQTTLRHFDLCPRHGFGGHGAPDLAPPHKRQHLFVHLRLLVVNVHAVVRDIDPRRRAVPFGIDELIESIERRQPRRLRLHAVFPRQCHVQIRALNLHAILLRPSQRVLQRNDQRRLRPRRAQEDDKEAENDQRRGHACSSGSPLPEKPLKTFMEHALGVPCRDSSRHWFRGVYQDKYGEIFPLYSCYCSTYSVIEEPENTAAPTAVEGGIAAPCPPAFSIVGIGASAGGLEACSALLKRLPADTGLAFVVIQHLDPKHDSLLPSLLSRVSAIPVQAVQGETLVEPNHVYVMPPNAEIVLSRELQVTKLKLIPREKTPAGTFMPIDGFFRSLAENCQHRAVGVVLSGSGSDGALGLEQIKSEGGLTFAQDTQSAKFDGMPYSAFATGSVDFVLPPEGIAQELVKVAKYPYARKAEDAPGPADVPLDRPDLRGILTFLHDAVGIDFSQYRTSTIQRRIFRRMAIHQIVEPETYRRFLSETPGEVQLLCEEMIPRVTRFFRDPEVFAALQKKVFPKFLIDRTRDAPIRIWVPGCASGEEVYSIAICLIEFLREIKADLPIQIFGTDLSVMAIQKARKGCYPARIADDVSPERLERFFTKRDDGYQINTSVRDACIFANHDLIGDPPYSKLDLISCRNVLIYLDSVQTRIIPIFHYALKPAGFLLLGVMETARRFSDLFAPVDSSAQIYAKKNAAHRIAGSWGAIRAAAPARARIAVDAVEDSDLQKRADRLVLNMYGPGGVVVDEHWHVLQIRGQISPWLEPAPGKMSANVLSMARRSGLVLDLAAALEQAKSENVPVRRENLRSPGEKARSMFK